MRYALSRPKPNVLLELANKKTFKIDQVLEAEAIWAVFYKDKPVNLKTSDLVIRTKSKKPISKYKKVSFSNRGHAINLAQKLNRMYECQDFTVVKLTEGVRLRRS